MKTIFLVVLLSVILLLSSCVQTEPDTIDNSFYEEENQAELSNVESVSDPSNENSENNIEFEALKIYTLPNEAYFYSNSGNKVDLSEYTINDDFADGRLIVQMNTLYGMLDESGKLVLQLEYNHISQYFDDKYLINKIDDATNSMWGIADKNGDFVLDLVYSWISPEISENMIGVAQNGKYGFLDSTFAEIIPLGYDYAYLFSGGLSLAMKNGKWGYIDKDNSIVIPFEFMKGSLANNDYVCVFPVYIEASEDEEGMPTIFLANHKIFKTNGEEIYSNDKILLNPEAIYMSFYEDSNWDGSFPEIDFQQLTIEDINLNGMWQRSIDTEKAITPYNIFSVPFKTEQIVSDLIYTVYKS